MTRRLLLSYLAITLVVLAIATVIGTGPVGRATLVTKRRGVASSQVLFDAAVRAKRPVPSGCAQNERMRRCSACQYSRYWTAPSA